MSAAVSGKVYTGQSVDHIFIGVDKMETEEFISGFCRTCNGSQTVCCEYEERDGKRILTFMDCAYKRCVHHGACEIYKEAHRLGSEEE